MPVALCFFLSGAAALILQVLWTRMLGHVFGATALAVSTILTVFMGGLALGSHLGGRWAARLQRPLLVFALLESAVGLYGLAVPSLLDAMPAVQRVLVPDGVGFWGYAIVRFALVTLILIVPTTAMGATLPILAQGVVNRSDEMAPQVGTLYAANTFGAVVGCLVGGFYLIPSLGMTATVYVAAAVDVGVAVIVAALFGWGGAAALLGRKPDVVPLQLDPPRMVDLSAGDQQRALVVFALSGGAAMALEVLWTRTIGVVIGASTYSFTLILTTFLVGLAVGAAVMTRRVRLIRDPIKVLAYVQLTVGTTAIMANLVADRLPRLLHMFARADGVTVGHLYVANFLISAAVMLPSTLALGAVMPLVVKILAPTDEAGRDAGSIVGRAYALNTVGAIGGSFLAGFVLLPVIGVERGVGLASVVSLTLGVWLLVDRPRLRHRAAVTLAVGVAVILFAPRWDVRAWTAGLFRMYLARNVYAAGWQPYGHIVFHRDGMATTVTVERQDDGIGVALKVNGKVDASDIGDMPTQVLSGLLPIMLHPDPKKVLVVGYGSGVTPGAVLQAPIASLHVAEIEGSVYDASNRYFAHVNNRPAEDPRSRLIVDDGRNFLRTRSETYDVIISEPSNPWMTGAASLFTTDFFTIAQRRLRPDGIFLQWLQLYELSSQNVHTLVRTFKHVFPEVLIFTPDPSSNDMLLVGSRQPLVVDKARIERWLADPKMQKELDKAGFGAAEDLLGLMLIDGSRLPDYIGRGPLNTDDNALIEFAAPKDLLTYSTEDAYLPFVYALDGRRGELLGNVFRGFGPPWTRMAERLLWNGQTDDAAKFLTRAQASKEPGADRVGRILRLVTGGDSEPVIVANEVTKADKRYAEAALAMLDRRERDALAIADGSERFEDRSLAHRLLYAFLCYRFERYGDADALIEPVLKDEAFVKKYPSALYYAGRIAIGRREHREGVLLLQRFDAARRAAKPADE